MARIRCKYLECEFLDDNYCSAALVELDSNRGCLTFTPSSKKPVEDMIDTVDDMDDWYKNDNDEEDLDVEDWIEDEPEEEDEEDEEGY